MQWKYYEQFVSYRFMWSVNTSGNWYSDVSVLAEEPPHLDSSVQLEVLNALQ